MKASLLFRCFLRLCLLAFWGAVGLASAGCVSTANGQRLGTFASHHKLSQTSEDTTHITFSGSGTSMTFEADSRKLFFNGVLIWLNAPVEATNKQWSVTTADRDRILTPLLRSSDTLKTAAASRIVLDPGHGGKDTGARGHHGTVEKTLVLDIARRARQALTRSGISTKITRGGDTTLPLSKRVDRATQWKADAFVSIHLNFASNQHAYGLETYVLTAPTFPSTAKGSMPSKAQPGNRHDAASMTLAYRIHKELLNVTRAPDRGIRHARFEVIREAPCPAVLVECGFLSNREEAAKLNSRDYREKLARAIAAGIQSYARKTPAD